MRGLPCLCVAACIAVTTPAAWAAEWYVPMGFGVDGGFDHVQVLMDAPHRFDAPAIGGFVGSSVAGDWSQTSLSIDQTLATADGPNTGAEDLYFTLWIDADHLSDLPLFHFQAYRGDLLVSNYDLIFLGPDSEDWVLNWEVVDGTWAGVRVPEPVVFSTVAFAAASFVLRRPARSGRGAA